MHSTGYPSVLQWAWRLCLAALLTVALTAGEQRAAPAHAGPNATATCTCPVGPYTDPLPGSQPAVTTTADPNVGLSPNGTYRLTVSGTSQVTLVITRVATGATVLTQTVGLNSGWGFSPDDDRFLIHTLASGQESIALYNLAPAPPPGAAIWTDQSFPSNSRYIFSPNGRYFMYEFVSGVNTTTIKILEAATGTLKYNTTFTFQTPPGTPEDAYGVVGWGFSPDNADHGFVFAYVTGPNSVELRLLNLALTTALVHTETITAASAFWQFSPCGDVLGLVAPITQTTEGVRLFLVSTGALAAPETQLPIYYTVLSSEMAGIDSVDHFATYYPSPPAAPLKTKLATVATPGACMPGVPVVSTLKLNPTSLQGGSPSTGTVGLNQKAPAGGTTVTLTSGNTGIATTPASVTVPADSTSAPFTVTTKVIPTTADVIISAAAGGVTRGAALTVLGQVPVSTIALNPTTVVGGNASTATITLAQPAAAGDSVVNLRSDTAAASVPATATVPAGTWTKTFTITTTSVSSITTATITASSGGVSKSAVLTINPVALSSITFDHFRVVGGHDASGHVTLTGPAPSGGIVVMLSTNNSGLTTPPASVTVPAGANTATVTVPTNAVAYPTEVMISGTYGGATVRTTIRLIAPPSYTITNIGTVLSDTWSEAYGINASGQVVGRSWKYGGVFHAFLFSGGAMGSISPPGVLDSAEATAINASGQVVGGARLSTGSGGHDHAFFYDPSHGTRDLGTLGGLSSWAYAINDAGKVVGAADTAAGQRHAFVWNPVTTTMQDIGTLGGPSSEAFAINASGQVAGVADYVTGNTSLHHAFLWDPASQHMLDLGVLTMDPPCSYLPACGFSGARSVNAWGQVAGWSSSGNDVESPIIYDSNGMRNLDPCIITWALCDPRSMNDFGKLVAQSYSGGGGLYRCGRWNFLEDLYSPDADFPGGGAANGINNAGQIVGVGTAVGSTYNPRAFLMTPISSVDAPLTATGGFSVSAVEGKSSPVHVADFTDADPSAVAACYGATTIDWGDGSLSTGVISAKPGGGFSVTGTHAYTRAGSYAYTVTVRDVDGATATATGTATVTPAPTTFYFAEGFTGSGFSEALSLLMPNMSGTATIDYYLNGGVHQTASATLVAGKVTVVDVNLAVGAGKEVSAKVTLPGPGVAERTIHFNLPGQWHGSTGIVGATAPSTEWDFAEGSTLTNGAGGPLIFSEYLTLQNPNTSAVPVSLYYFTDTGLTPSKTLTLAANSRTTVEVFHGDTTNVSNCIPSGTSGSCGVGPGIGGVSVQVKSGTLPIIAERPLYVDSYNLGDGVISDGHDTFGATAPASTWNFAEGTTLGGFREYLALQNPGTVAATVTLNYFTDTGAHPVKTLMVNAHSRVTVEVFHGSATANVNPCTPNGASANCGVGPNIGGVSVQVTSNQPIVAERPMYMVLNFGTGVVAGAHVVVGATGLGTLFGFAAASTLAGENDYLTIQNPGSVAAQVTITYFTNAGTVLNSLSVSPNSRVTVEVFRGSMTSNPACSPSAGTCGVGAGVSPLGIVLQSSQPILVEKPTYNSTSAAYGATDTLGYSPSSF